MGGRRVSLPGKVCRGQANLFPVSLGPLGVSGRNRPFQLRIRAGDAACVLTWGIGAFDVWLCLRRITTRARQFEQLSQVLLGSGTLGGYLDIS